MQAIPKAVSRTLIHPFPMMLGIAVTAGLVMTATLANSQVPSDAVDPAAQTRALPESPRPQPRGTLTLGERFRIEAHTTLGPSAFLVPAAEAALTMANPPSHYPREWSDGGGAFGRNYGAELVRHTTGGLTHFAVAAADREDPRYYPSTSTNYARRAVHALMFTVVDRSDSGRRTFALSNFAGATAGGFVGMGIYPDGFNDTTHAYQRSAKEFASFGAHNLTSEFAPEVVKVLRKLHLSERLADAFLPNDRQP